MPGGCTPSVVVAVEELADESQPLLPQAPHDAASTHGRSPRSRWHVYALFFIVAGIDSTVFMLSLPLTRVYESITCYQWYLSAQPSRYPDPSSIPESMCKIPQVQEKLATLRGYELLFMALPGT
jgi:hypothetical protein